MRSAVGHGIGGGDEGERGHQHLVVRPDTRREQRDVKGGRTVHGGHGMVDADVGGNFQLEAAHEGPDRGHPVGVEAFLEVLPLVAGEMRHGVRNGPARLRHRAASWLCVPLAVPGEGVAHARLQGDLGHEARQRAGGG